MSLSKLTLTNPTLLESTLAKPTRGWLSRRLGNRDEAQGSDPVSARELLDLVQEVVCLRDSEGIVRYASPSAQTVLGRSPEELVGMPLDVHLHPDDRMAALAAWQRLQAIGTMAPLDFRWMHPSGDVLWIEMTLSVLPARAGSLAGQRFGTVIRDVTRQRFLNTALQRTRDELTGAIAAGPGVLYRLTPSMDGRWQLVFVSSNIERMAGFTVAEATEMQWPDATMSNEDVWRRWRSMEEALEHGVASVEYDMLAHDGSSFRVVDHLRRRDRADGTVEVVGYLQEVTEERATERKLMLARQEIDTLTRAGPGLLYRARADGAGNRQILSVSENVERVTGFTAEEVMQLGWFADHCDSASSGSLADALLHLRSNGTVTLEFRFRDRGGAWRWVRDSVRVVANDGDDVELVGYWTDITRERELASQLAEAGKLALLGELATGMTHELKQPLATISMATEIAILALQQSPSDVSMAIRKLDRIVEQAQRTARLIDHMRIFGRRQDGTTGPVDLRAAIEGASTIMTGRMNSTQIELFCELPDDLPPVHGQSVLIEQVLINLFANACDAYPAADPSGPDELRRIELVAEVRDRAVVATITDHAGGISEAIINRVFEPFFTTKPPDKGTGLGLSISYGIVRDLGGMMTVRNVGDGAAFELQLPIHDAASVSVNGQRQTRNIQSMVAE
jgi:PAS domain S-box-containing protein